MSTPQIFRGLATVAQQLREDPGPSNLYIYKHTAVGETHETNTKSHFIYYDSCLEGVVSKVKVSINRSQISNFSIGWFRTCFDPHLPSPATPVLFALTLSESLLGCYQLSKPYRFVYRTELDSRSMSTTKYERMRLSNLTAPKQTGAPFRNRSINRQQPTVHRDLMLSRGKHTPSPTDDVCRTALYFCILCIFFPPRCSSTPDMF